MSSVEDLKMSPEELTRKLKMKLLDLAKILKENPDFFPLVRDDPVKIARRGSKIQKQASREKYSQAYFEERIQKSRAKIVKKLPNKESLVGTVFLPLLAALKSAKTSLEASKNLKKKLEDAQKKHPDDDGYASLVDDLKEALDESQSSIQKLEEAVTNEGCAIAKTSNLLTNLLQVEQCLLECTILVQATPKKLAEWVQESPDSNGKLLDDFLLGCQRFLNGQSLMTVFLQQGGPSNGNYGPALAIYTQLQNEIQCATCDTLDLLERLALAVALELATPVQIFKQETYVDPLERFRYYAKLAKTDQLDEAFYNLSIWELRKVIDVNATHEDLTWAREFLKNYRPDEVAWKDEKWRYIEAVRTDVGYRHPDHEFENYQQLISAGGECGPRAFFGRFIAKAWGIPTWGCRQPGHAAMTHYTTSGWVVCLGADWPYSWWDDDRYCGGETKTRHGPDFFEETKARNAPADIYYKQVVLMECLAESLGETVEEEFVETKFWRSLALAQRKCLAQEYGSNETITSETSSINNITTSKQPQEFTKIDAKQDEQSDGVVIPASSFCDPPKPTNSVMILDSFTGGKQLHLSGDGTIEYELPANLAAGTYELSANLVSVHQRQLPLVVQVKNNDSIDGYELIDEGQELEVPYTKGYWQDTESIRVDLGGSGGRLKFQFTHSLSSWGLSIKEFVLKPIATTTN